jgi:hypothetical protein
MRDALESLLPKITGDRGIIEFFNRIGGKRTSDAGRWTPPKAEYEALYASKVGKRLLKMISGTAQPPLVPEQHPLVSYICSACGPSELQR